MKSNWPRLREQAISLIGPGGQWRIERARAIRLLQKLSPHTDWMNECVPYMMGRGREQDVAVAACLNMWRDAWEEAHPEGADDPGPDRPQPDDAEEGSEEKRLRIARELLAKKVDFIQDPATGRLMGSHPQGGSDKEPSGEPKGTGEATELNPAVVNVSGGQWNKQTAVRLEREYQEARPAMEKLSADIVARESAGQSSEAWRRTAQGPTGWGDLSSGTKIEVRELWIDANQQNAYQDEVRRWRESGRALEVARKLTGGDESKAKAMAETMEPPDYISHNAEESAKEVWHAMPDEQKFDLAQAHTHLLEDWEFSTEQLKLDALPSKFDPLQEEGGEDYQRTLVLARHLSVDRSKQVLAERKMPYPGDAAMAKIDQRLWSAWRESSSSDDGLLLQVAVSDELGGRLNSKTGYGGKIEVNKDQRRAYGDEHFKSIGGYDGVKAYVRAKWETTQFLLDKAGKHDLELYRSVVLTGDKLEQANREKGSEYVSVEDIGMMLKQFVSGHQYVPTIHIERNGALSTTTDPNVANKWMRGQPGHTVMRIVIPRTAALSIPAYGINVHRQREVVVAGTAWKKWDAWLGPAPTTNVVPVEPSLAG